MPFLIIEFGCLNVIKGGVWAYAEKVEACVIYMLWAQVAMGEGEFLFNFFVGVGEGGKLCVFSNCPCFNHIIVCVICAYVHWGVLQKW